MLVGFLLGGTRTQSRDAGISLRSSNTLSSSWIVPSNLSGSCSKTTRSQSSLQRSLVLPRKGVTLQTRESDSVHNSYERCR
jgi:hypothetical protein